MREQVGFCQTTDGEHVSGKNGHFPVGLVQGQYGFMSLDDWLEFLVNAGFDGCELASWQLDLNRCRTDEEAEVYAQELFDKLKRLNLTIFSLAAHLQGQAMGDEPSAKTLQFVGGQAVELYTKWRSIGNNPPENDPFYVPEDVALAIHQQAESDLIATIRLAFGLGNLQKRDVVVTGFVGSPANCWSHHFEFPPLPKEIGGYEIPNVRKVSLELLLKRFEKVFEALWQNSVYFGLECHPSEAAMGDIASAREFLAAVDEEFEPSYSERIGFNFDPSHLVWQGVDPVAFIREFGDRIFAVHIKGVQVSRHPTVNGLLGGHQPMGDPDNGWNFVTACSDRDSVRQDEVLTELRRIGYQGAISVEWEDNDADPKDGARLALAGLKRINVAPSGMKHDEALKAK